MKDRSERPLLPQHHDGVRYTATLHDGGQRSVSEHQRRSAPPQRAQYEQQEHERISLPKPLQAVQLEARGASNERSRSEPPLLPQHRDDVRRTATLHDVEQRSISEHQCQSAPPPRAQYIHPEHERISSSNPLQAVQLSAPTVHQEQIQTPLQTSPQQVNEPVQNAVLIPPATLSPTEPKREAAQTYQATEAALASDADGAVSQHPQDDTDEGSSDYVSLRERAKQEREAIRKYREEKQQARTSGQSALVEELDQKIKCHSQRSQLFDEQASHLIFTKNNKNRSPDQVDLHGLTVMEATTYAKRAIHEACERGITEMRLIVGKGLHSSGPPVLKPCMLKLMQKLKLPVKVHPSNEGVLVVQLAPTSIAAPPTVWDQTLSQFSLPQICQLLQILQIPALVPQVYAPPAEPDQWAHDLSRESVWYCQRMSQLPRNSAHHDAEDGNGDGFMLREYAKQERQMKLNYRKEKKLAKARGQLMLASELAEKENEHNKRCNMLNAQASELIFAQNNKHDSLDWVILHDLKAKEAKTHTERVIEEARANGNIEIRLVVGEQSSPGALKPAILNFLKKKCGLSVEDDTTYEGVLVVQLVPTNNASPAVGDQPLLQPSLSQTNQPATSPIVVSHIDASPDRSTGDSSRDPVQNRQATSPPLVPVWGEDLTELPQNAAHHDAEDGKIDFMMLREYAKQEKQMKLNYRKEKKLAKARGQLVLARELAEKEIEHKSRCNMLNAQASELIFAQNNKHDSLDWAILHDLKAKEAKPHATRFIQEARAEGYTEVRLVVGEQSSPGALKPAMLDFLRKKCGLSVEDDTTYEGVLVVQLLSTSDASPTVCDQPLLQPSLSQTNQPAPSPIAVSCIEVSPMEADRLTGDSSRDSIQNCQATPTSLVSVRGEELSELPQNTARHDAEDGGGGFIMLRERAKQERQMGLNYRKEKKLTKARGQMAPAGTLAGKENELKKGCDILNAQASELIFAQNNKNCSSDKVVLKDLKTKEAKPHAKRVIQEARENGNNEVHPVVGQQGSQSALKSVVLKFLKKKMWALSGSRRHK